MNLRSFFCSENKQTSIVSNDVISASITTGMKHRQSWLHDRKSNMYAKVSLFNETLLHCAIFLSTML